MNREITNSGREAGTLTLSVLLVSLGVTTSYLILFIGYVVPRFVSLVYRPAPNTLGDFLPALTLIACRFSWAFALAVILAVVASIFAANFRPAKSVQILILGAAAQGAILWAAMFCYCYMGFYGEFSVHHAPAFDILEFLSFGWGVFPITLAAILAPVIAVFWMPKQRVALRAFGAGLLIAFVCVLHSGCRQYPGGMQTRVLHLQDIYSEWESRGRPAGYAWSGLGLGTNVYNGYFVFTNVVTSGKSVYHCRFAYRYGGWPGTLAITDERVALWIRDRDGNVRVAPEKNGILP